MTCDERLEKLLNRAGQTINDLPIAFSYDSMINAHESAKSYFTECGYDAPTDTSMEIELGYILHPTDVIDRMETALDTILNERDYTRAKCCFLCGLVEGESQTCEECGIPKVPDDWRVDK